MLLIDCNPQTAHFINWCRYSGGVDLPAMLREARSAAEKYLEAGRRRDAEEATPEELADELAERTCNHLAYALADALYEVRDELFGFLHACADPDGFDGPENYREPEHFRPDDPAEYLVVPIVDQAFALIDCDFAADYLLRHATAEAVAA